MTPIQAAHLMSGSFLNFDCPNSSVPFVCMKPDLSFTLQIGTVMTSTRDFYSFRHGAFDVTVLSDAPPRYQDFGSGGTSPEGASGGSHAEGSEADAVCLAPSNIPFLVTADEMILVDVGAGAGAGERKSENSGFLEANLESIGVAAPDITLVILTHAHPCHIWGLVRIDGSLRYTKARYVMSEAEWSFWMADKDEPTTDYERMTRDHTRRVLSAILGRVTLVEDGDEIIPGLRVLDASGHTPGHIAVILESDVPLIVTGDSVASDVVSFEHPDWSFGFDIDAKQAAATRRNVLKRAEEARAKLLGFRWQYPGVGRTERAGSAFRLRRVVEVAR